MNRVVYILGAGFSAPLGIPAVRNFLEKSKDLYFTDEMKYAHFSDIFRTIDELSKCKNYYSIDLFNIEDILSLLEMRSSLDNDEKIRKNFVRFVVDVVQAYTPDMKLDLPGGSWINNVFGNSQLAHYSLFVSAIFGRAFVMRSLPVGQNHYNSTSRSTKTAYPEYSVITLNYDTVLEGLANEMNGRFGEKHEFIRRLDDRPTEATFGGILAKLHGSVDSTSIIPPTWNKQIADASILTAWQAAHWLLERANHVRVIGYSLPQADNYIKYLFRAAIVDNPHLKSFDVLCLDPDGSVETRYDDFVKFPKYRFKSVDVETLLSTYELALRSHVEVWPTKLDLPSLEQAHETTMRY
jgi:hypothetical protein